MNTPVLVSYVGLWLLVALQGLLIIGLLRVVYRLQSEVIAPGLADGDPGPDFMATALSGEAIASAAFRGARTALLFVSTTCQGCRATLEDLSPLKAKAAGRLIVICAGDEAATRALAETYSLNVPVVPDPDLAISRLYRIDSVPTAVLIGAGGIIEKYGSQMQDGALVKEQLAPKEAAVEAV